LRGGRAPAPARRADSRRARAHPRRPRPRLQARARHRLSPMLRIVPLGGLGEVGKNMMVYEQGDDAVVVDAGLSFPRDEQLGVDLVLPDFGYLAARRGRPLAVLLTHGHEDHVGALPYLLREVGAPSVYGTKLTLELVASKLDEHGLLRATELREVTPEDGPF